MLIISGKHLAAMIPGHTYTVVANSAMKGNEALLYYFARNSTYPGRLPCCWPMPMFGIRYSGSYELPFPSMHRVYRLVGQFLKIPTVYEWGKKKGRIG